MLEMFLNQYFISSSLTSHGSIEKLTGGTPRQADAASSLALFMTGIRTRSFCYGLGPILSAGGDNEDYGRSGSTTDFAGPTYTYMVALSDLR
jgi:hypothetical protein